MTLAQDFRLSGTALPKNAEHMLEEICEHFVEHSEVARTKDLVVLKSEIGIADIRLTQNRLLIDLTCPSQDALQLSRNMLAEHLFYFAGDDPFDLTWSDPAPLALMPNIHEVTVAGSEEVTPLMRRVKFRCADITPFIGGGMHVRLLVPPKGRKPVWPSLREDGRTGWPEGDDKLLVRVYTIRGVDAERRELWIDFLQHPAPGVQTPGADFARDALPGESLALLGPGGGDFPEAETILLIGDESALPAIARIAAEAAPNTQLNAIIEIANEAEQQPLPTAGSLQVQWLHRDRYPANASGTLVQAATAALTGVDNDTYVWIACEKEDVRAFRSVLKSRQHNKKRMYAAWYWERDHG